MSLTTRPVPPPVEYPDSDGMPMAENMTQYRWIVTLQGGLNDLLPNDLVAADNLIYPVEGRPDIRQAPDVYVAVGRPKGERGSYKVWEEGGVSPQVVFEIVSPGNRLRELVRKQQFYDGYGVEEYYQYDPDRGRLSGYVRGADGELAEVWNMDGHVSPRLGIRFDLSGDELTIYRPDGTRFKTFAEVFQEARAEAQRADAERQRADSERQRADAERQRAEAAERANAALRAKLRALGLDSDAP